MKIFRAKYGVSEEFSLVENPVISCEHGEIVDVAAKSSVDDRSNVVDFGDAVILPGLINAHTHLELQGLKGKIPSTHSFVDWLGKIIRFRVMPFNLFLKRDARKGIRENISHGVTTIADIATNHASIKPLLKSPVRKRIFFEVLDVRRLKSQSLEFFEKQAAGIREDDLVGCGISPHAPYTVSKKMFERIRKLIRQKHLYVQIHTSETEEENDFWERNTGKLKEFFEKMGLTKRIISPGMSPVKYLHWLGMLGERIILVHCNYLAPGDVELVARSGSSIVFCPGSHSFFHHAPYPLREYLNAGINVCIGTDGASSNEELNMLREMKIVCETIKDVAPEAILRMATLNGAKALGMDAMTGRIAKGFKCDLCAVEIQGGKLTSLNDLFEQDNLTNLATIVDGNMIFETR